MTRRRRFPFLGLCAARMALLAAFCAVSVPLVSETAFDIVPSVAPGVYAEPQLVSFAIPKDTRLLVRIDGAAAFEPAGSILLSADSGEDRDYAVDVELRSLDPSSAPSQKARFAWRVDRKSPAVPTFSVRAADGGTEVTASINEPGTVECRLYNPSCRASASESVVSGGSLFVPSGTVLCAWGVDLAGNRGPSALPDLSATETNERPFRVVSPVSGNWSNPQVLLIDCVPGVDVFYSLDGSDPALSGLDYSGPIQLPTGRQRLRVFACDAAGVRYDADVDFTVSPDPADQSAILGGAGALKTDRGLIDTKDFGEIAIPSGMRWSLGDADPKNDGGKTVVFSGIRGMMRYETLVVSDGAHTWRWVCASGSVPKRDDEPSGGSSPIAPSVVIHDWYFIDIGWNAPVYVSRDKKSWVPLDGPVFDERIRDSSLFWYSDTWKSGEVQTIRLPAKPSIAGIADRGVTANPVLLTLGNSPFGARYEISSGIHARLPDRYSASLDDGILFEIPRDTESTFSVRLLCELDGIVHGELTSSFTIDRKIPGVPVIGIASPVTWSRVPVTFRPTGEDSLRVSVSPESFSRRDSSYTLNGSERGPVTYAISAYSVDRAGNASPCATATVTVDLNALSVDSEARVSGVRDGSPSAPFATLDEALDAVYGSAPARISVKGSPALNRWHELRSPVSIDARGSAIRVGKNGGIRMRDALLSVAGCSVSYAGDVSPSASLAPSTSASGLLFDVRGGALSLDGVRFVAERNSPSPLISVSNATVSCVDCLFSLVSGEYALLFSAASSSVSFDRCSFAARGDSVSAVSLSSSTMRMDGVSIGLTPGRVGRAVECWDSRVTATNLAVERIGGAVNKDTAIWSDGTSLVSFTGTLNVRGFWRESSATKK